MWTGCLNEQPVRSANCAEYRIAVFIERSAAGSVNGAEYRIAVFIERSAAGSVNGAEYRGLIAACFVVFESGNCVGFTR